MKDLTISDFPHEQPDGFSYEYEQFNSRIISIWLRFERQFSYNGGKSTKSIWGFYSPKKREYYAPINSTKMGKQVNISHTTPYSAMPVNLTPLERCFQ